MAEPVASARVPCRWRARAETLEAAACLLAARFLIANVRFGRWRRLLGRLGAAPGSAAAPDEAWRLARVVERGVLRTPLPMRCLPQAMALTWMLRRRGMHPLLVIAVLPGRARGGLDDLHAWVEMAGDTLIGETEQPHKPLARFG